MNSARASLNLRYRARRWRTPPSLPSGPVDRIHERLTLPRLQSRFAFIRSSFLLPNNAMAATGADLPPELLDIILRYTGTDRNGRYMSSYHTPSWEMKRSLSAFSLVCRYWARHCRSNIFRRITLRSAEDVTTFVSILDCMPVSDVTPVYELIEQLSVSQRSTYEKPPWLYLVPLRVFPRLPMLRDIEFISDEDIPSGHRSLQPHSRVLLYHVGCSTPNDIKLTNVHFDDAAEFSRIVSGCCRGSRGRNVIRLQDVTWRMLPNEDAFLMLQTTCLLIPQFRMCFRNAAITSYWMLAMRLALPGITPPSAMPTEEYLLICKAISSLSSVPFSRSELQCTDQCTWFAMVNWCLAYRCMFLAFSPNQSHGIFR